jgi:hypothetical protein
MKAIEDRFVFELANADRERYGLAKSEIIYKGEKR